MIIIKLSNNFYIYNLKVSILYLLIHYNLLKHVMAPDLSSKPVLAQGFARLGATKKMWGLYSPILYITSLCKGDIFSYDLLQIAL